MERTCAWLRMSGMVPHMLKKSRFCRRLHALSGFLDALFFRVGMHFKELSAHSRFLVDSFPVPLCDNYRIPRARIVHDEAFRGKIASKRRYFYGVKVQVVTTEEGIPVEFAILPGAASDVRGYDVLPLVLSEGSELYGDAAYCSYEREDVLLEQSKRRFFQDPVWAPHDLTSMREFLAELLERTENFTKRVEPKDWRYQPVP